MNTELATPPKAGVQVQMRSDGPPTISREGAYGGLRELTEEELEQVSGGNNSITVTYPDGCVLEVAVTTTIWDALDEANDWHTFLHNFNP